MFTPAIKEKKISRDQGIALLVTLFVLSIISVLSVCSVNRLLATGKVSGDHTVSMQAYYTAMSAKAAALYYLQDHHDADGYSSGVLDLRDTGNVLQGQYTYNILDVGLISIIPNVVVATINNELQYWNNDGTGALVEDDMSPYVSDTPWDVRAADIDDDGDYDLVVASFQSKFEVFKDIGAGDLTLDATYAVGGVPQRVAIGDVTGDGYPDIVVGTDAQQIEVWNNDGSGSFSKDANCPYATGGVVKCITLGYIEGNVGSDSDLDIIVGTSANQFEVWDNNGIGDFTQDASSPYTLNDVPQGIDSADIDNDSDVDIVAGTVANQIEIWDNDGDGTFTVDGSSPRTLSDQANEVVLVDVTGDDYPDVIVAINASRFEVWNNDISGAFSEDAQSPYDCGSQVIDIVGMDLDADDDIDVVLGTNNGNLRVWLNNGSGDFSQEASSPHSVMAKVVAVASWEKKVPIKKIEVTAYYPTKDQYD